MLIESLLNQAVPQQTAGAKRCALELQQLIIDMPRLNLDVDISVKGKDVVIEYTDSKHVMGKVTLTQHGDHCVAWTIDDSRTWVGGSFEGAAPLILYRLIQSQSFYKYFEQKLVTAFGNAHLQFMPVNKKSTDAAWWQVTPSFNLPHMRVDSGIVQYLIVRLTETSDVRLTLIDAHSDYHDLEPFPTVHAAQLDLERFLKAADPELQDHQSGFVPRARRSREAA